MRDEDTATTAQRSSVRAHPGRRAGGIDGRPCLPALSKEATIADIHAVLKARTLTCCALVQMHLDRIEAYDKKGPALNAIVTVNVNANALTIADALDVRFAQSGPSGPLHCVPIVAKDNDDTVDMPTSAGSLSLKGSIPPRDAFQNKMLREAGAIILVKANMAELAFDPFEKRLIDRHAEPALAENERCQRAVENGAWLRDALQKAMDDATLDPLVYYPSAPFPPRMIGDLNTPHGNDSPRLSPPTGLPAITVPMGFVRDTLPVGLQVLGRSWSEPTPIKIVYAYEQATRHRRPPASTPARP